jgi:hypothetical protein
VKTLNDKIAYGLGHGKLQSSKRRSANKREAEGVPIFPDALFQVGQREKPTGRIGFDSAAEARAPNGRERLEASSIVWNTHPSREGSTMKYLAFRCFPVADSNSN